MKELVLKYGCNPNQKPAKIYMKNSKDLPLTVLNSNPGYINLLDALNAYQLVKELKQATGYAAATSFKHVSPAGAALGYELSAEDKKVFFVDESLDLSPIACAYIRARGTDRMSSFGDFIALSDECDEACARYILKEVSDGIIAPSYSQKALELLKGKRKGNYTIIQIDEDYTPELVEEKDVFGITFSQNRNNLAINEDLFNEIVTKNKDLPKKALNDLVLGMITLKYTQSNSICYTKDGQTIGVGAGQQSRIHCTRLAGDKADVYNLRRHPKVQSLNFVDKISRADRDNAIDVYISNEYEDVLKDGIWQEKFKTKPEVLTLEEKKEYLKTITDVSLSSDAFLPFGDNILRAYKSGVKFVAQAGGSVRDDNVINTCDDLDMVMCFTHTRLFHH